MSATPYLRETGILKDKCGSFVLRLMNDYGACIAGGAVTSVFSGSKINDFDLFFPSRSALDEALALTERDEKTIETDAALSVIVNGHRVQLIKILTGAPGEIIDSFDFTVCQAAFKSDLFCFGPHFFHHLAQRRLVFNINAKFPICSLYRTRKFIARGFSFSGIEAIKLGLCVENLNIQTLGELRAQLMGIDTLFLQELTDSLKGQEEKQYDLNEFLCMLDAHTERLDALTGADTESHQ